MGEHLKAFQAECETRGVELDLDSIQWVESEDKPIEVPGTCFNHLNRVVLSRAFLERNSDVRNEALIFHEAFHCYFGVEHFEESADLMNAALISQSAFESKREELLERVFLRMENKK